MTTKLKGRFSLLFVAFAVMLVIPVVAFAADTLKDNVTNNSGSLDLGTIAPGDSKSGNVSLTLTCNGQGGHLPSGQTQFSITKTLNAGSAGSVDEISVSTNLIVPNTWPTDQAACDANDSPVSGTATVDVSVPSGAAAGSRSIMVKLDPADQGGANVVNFPVTYTVANNAPPAPSDTTPPVITPHVAGTLGNNGWYVSDVTVTWDVQDNESTVSSSTGCTPSSVTSDTDASGVTFTCTATSAGGTSSQSVTIKRDATAPTINATLDKSPAASGWYNIATGAPTVSFACSDPVPGSGLAAGACPASYTFGEGANQSHSGTVSDLAGNTASASVSGINVDLGKPLLGITDNNAATFNVCGADRPSKPLFQPSDAISGIDATQTSDSFTSNLQPSGVGNYTYSAQAFDLASNSDSYSRTYSVVYGAAFGGVLQPINGGSTMNDFSDDNSRFKLGSTVPVKFQLMCGTTPIGNAVAKLNVKKADGTPDPGVDEAVSTAASTTGNLFRYDATSQQYIFNLSTKTGYTNPNGTTVSAFSAGTWTLSVLLDDGSYRSININLVR